MRDSARGLDGADLPSNLFQQFAQPPITIDERGGSIQQRLTPNPQFVEGRTMLADAFDPEHRLDEAELMFRTFHATSCLYSEGSRIARGMPLAGG